MSDRENNVWLIALGAILIAFGFYAWATKDVNAQVTEAPIIIGVPFQQVASSPAPACFTKEAIDDVFRTLRKHGTEALMDHFDTYWKQGKCARFIGMFVVTERYESFDIQIGEDTPRFTIVKALHTWRGKVTEIYTFTYRRVLTAEEWQLLNLTGA